jgi:hypothetical protein
MSFPNIYTGRVYPVAHVTIHCPFLIFGAPWLSGALLSCRVCRLPVIIYIIIIFIVQTISRTDDRSFEYLLTFYRSVNEKHLNVAVILRHLWGNNWGVWTSVCWHFDSMREPSSASESKGKNIYRYQDTPFLIITMWECTPCYIIRLMGNNYSTQQNIVNYIHFIFMLFSSA